MIWCWLTHKRHWLAVCDELGGHRQRICIMCGKRWPAAPRQALRSTETR